MLEKGNYEYNKAVSVPEGLILGQNTSPAGRLRFGVMPLSSVGSGVIAAYNLLVMLNRAVPLADVVREVYLKARTPLGLLGVHPTRLIRLFSSRYMPVIIDRSRDSALANFTPGCKGIIVWWKGRRFFSRIRFAAIENEGGAIRAYNRLADKTEADEFSRLDGIADEKHFFACYRIDTVGTDYV